MTRKEAVPPYSPCSLLLTRKCWHPAQLPFLAHHIPTVFTDNVIYKALKIADLMHPIKNIQAPLHLQERQLSQILPGQTARKVFYFQINPTESPHYR